MTDEILKTFFFLWTILIGLLVCAGIHNQWCWWKVWGGVFPWKKRQPEQPKCLQNNNQGKPKN